MKNKILITGGSGFIGTNLIDLLINRGYDNIVNFDKVKPLRNIHNNYWIEGNIMNSQLLEAVISAINPDVVIHLAARTDTLSDNLQDYEENITGTKNVLASIKKSASVKRAIITSTQYVYKSDDQPLPLTDDHYCPHTVYGESKVLTEKFTRQANLSCCWTIIRPTNIWGPWHMRYPNELWKAIDRRIFFHPVKHEVLRTYGYVKNVVHQIYEISIAPIDLVNQKMFYLGDEPIDSYLWLNELSMQLTKRRVKRLPKVFFQSLALVGDLLRIIKVPFPLYSRRLYNMIEDYPAPTNVTIKQFGMAEKDISKNVTETVDWLKSEGKFHFEYWNK